MTVVWISAPSVDVDAQFDQAVGQQQAIARPHAAREAGERGRKPARSADEVAGARSQRVAGLHAIGRAAVEPSGSDLRAAEILQDRDFAPRALAGGADAGECRRLRLVRAVRKIEPEDVGAGGDQRVEHRRRNRSPGRRSR